MFLEKSAICLALIVVAMVAGAANADTVFTWSSVPTTDLPGYTTLTLHVETTDGDIDSVDGLFTGTLNQVNPAGNSSIFMDSNAFFGFVGADVTQDSQFLFMSTDGLVAVQEENATMLTAAFTGVPAFTSRDIVQLCVADGTSITYAGNVGVVPAGGSRYLESFEGTMVVPEPATISLIGLGAVALIRRKK